MKLGVVLALVIAFPTAAAAQYGFQLRPSPYRVLSGWEQNANTRGQSIERVTRAVAPVSDRTRAGEVGGRPNGRAGDVTGSTPTPRY
jgi:hypothetical protein